MNDFPYEPPAKRYSLVTLALGLSGMLCFALAVVAFIEHWHWAIGLAGGMGSVYLFLIAKSKERADRLKYGADHESWMNSVGPGA